MEFSKMVREVPELFVDLEVQEPRRLDFSGEPEFSRQAVSNEDLVDAFSRFVSSRSGSFERLLKAWVGGRLRDNMPVNLEDPESSHLSPRLRKALLDGFERARAKRKRT
jgi:hypothetical protein